MAGRGGKGGAPLGFASGQEGKTGDEEALQGPLGDFVRGERGRAPQSGKKRGGRGGSQGQQKGPGF